MPKPESEWMVHKPAPVAEAELEEQRCKDEEEFEKRYERFLEEYDPEAKEQRPVR